MSPRLASVSAPVPVSELEGNFMHWRWLVGERARVIAMTVLGDWFFEGPDGGIWLLDTLEATVRVVAGSLGELEALLATDAGRDELVLETLALAATGDSLLPVGHCVGWRVPPVLGGATDGTNLAVVPTFSYQMFTGGLHEALSRLPPGARVLGVACDERGRVSVRWE